MGAQNAALQTHGQKAAQHGVFTVDMEKLGEATANLVSLGKIHPERMTIRTDGRIWTGYTIGAALGALAGLSFGKRVLLCPAVCLCLTAGLELLLAVAKSNPGVATTAGGYIAVRYMKLADPFAFAISMC